jgi:hypothetical protein
VLMKIQTQNPIRARRHDHVREQLGPYRHSRLVLSVLPRVSVVRHHARDTRRRCPACRVDQEQQLHDVVGRRICRLHDEDVVPSDVLIDADENLAVGEAGDRRLAKRNIQRSRYLNAQFRVPGPGNELEAMSGYG